MGCFWPMTEVMTILTLKKNNKTVQWIIHFLNLNLKNSFFFNKKKNWKMFLLIKFQILLTFLVKIPKKILMFFFLHGLTWNHPIATVFIWKSYFLLAIATEITGHSLCCLLNEWTHLGTTDCPESERLGTVYMDQTKSRYWFPDKKTKLMCRLASEKVHTNLPEMLSVMATSSCTALKWPRVLSTVQGTDTMWRHFALCCTDNCAWCRVQAAWISIAVQGSV